MRVQCAFVDTPEVERIANYISEQRGYPTAFMLPEYVDDSADSGGAAEVDMNRLDPLFEDLCPTGYLSPAGFYIAHPTEVFYRL